MDIIGWLRLSEPVCTTYIVILINLFFYNNFLNSKLKILIVNNVSFVRLYMEWDRKNWEGNKSLIKY